MAILDKNDETWWAYAREFARRGLWPVGEIETHGPHEAPADQLWGAALVVDDQNEAFEISFLGPRGIRHYSDIRGLRLSDEDGNRWAILPQGERSRKVRVWVRRCDEVLKAGGLGSD